MLSLASSDTADWPEERPVFQSGASKACERAGTKEAPTIPGWIMAATRLDSAATLPATIVGSFPN